MTVLPEARSLVLPLPVTLVTCRARPGDAATDNIIPLSWVGIVDYDPQTVSLSIGKNKYSAGVIAARREFGLCIAPVHLMEAVDRCGHTHGDRTDKFAMTGLTRVAAHRIDASIIAECPVCLECRVGKVVELPTHRLYIAEVLCTHVADDLLTEDGVDMARSKILCYGDNTYWELGKRLQALYYTRPSEG